MIVQVRQSNAYPRRSTTKQLSLVTNRYGTFLQQIECGYGFPALIHVWIASAGLLEWFISTSGVFNFNFSGNFDEIIHGQLTCDKSFFPKYPKELADLAR